MCSVCLPNFESSYHQYRDARRKRRKRKVVRFSKTIDVINLSLGGARGLHNNGATRSTGVVGGDELVNPSSSYFLIKFIGQLSFLHFTLQCNIFWFLGWRKLATGNKWWRIFTC